MPILPAEPDVHPPDLWEVHRTDWGDGRKWWCLHTKPRQEKATARDLRRHLVPFYLPQVVQEGHTPQGRRTRSVVPLFTSYLFLFGDDQERIRAFKGNRLVSMLEVTDQACLDRDLDQLRRMLASNLVVRPEPTMPVGAQVRIGTGPLAGMVGTVVRRGKHADFVAIVHFLGSGAAVELEDWQVERIEDDGPEPRSSAG